MTYPSIVLVASILSAISHATNIGIPPDYDFCPYMDGEISYDIIAHLSGIESQFSHFSLFFHISQIHITKLAIPLSYGFLKNPVFNQFNPLQDTCSTCFANST